MRDATVRGTLGNSEEVDCFASAADVLNDGLAKFAKHLATEGAVPPELAIRAAGLVGLALYGELLVVVAEGLAQKSRKQAAE